MGTAYDGINPYDLQPPAKSAALERQPLRAVPPGRRETHAERMARTDRQLEWDRRARELLDVVTAAGDDWTRVRGACEAEGNALGCAVLDLHRPLVRDWGVECEECSGYDYYGETRAEWPCNTFVEIKRFVP